MKVRNDYQIVVELLGPIKPLGDSSQDTKRLQNLEGLITVIALLLNDIQQCAEYKDSHEHSVKEIGVMANRFLTEVVSEYVPENI